MSGHEIEINKGFKVNVFGDFCTANKSGECNKTVFNDLSTYIKLGDLNIINLECVISTSGKPIKKTGPNLITGKADLEVLSDFAPILMTLANNHIGDFGEQGVLDTIEALDEKGFLHIGAGVNIEEAYKRAYFSRNGMTLCVLAVCENEFGVANHERGGVAGYNEGLLFRVIKNEKKRGNKILIIFHGGNEYYPLPSTFVQERYRFLVDIGASAIIAMHSHCTQGYEIYNNCPIIYGMGNFYFYKEAHKDQYDGWNNGFSTSLEFLEDFVKFELVPYRYDPNKDVIEKLKSVEKEEFLEYLDRQRSIIENSILLKKYYKAWASIKGPFMDLRLKASLINENMLGECEALNGFRCESNRELFRTYYETKYEINELNYMECMPGLKKLISFFSDKNHELGIADDEIMCIKEIEKMLLNGEKIYLYGAGRIAEGIIRMIPEGVRDYINGIVVSNKTENDHSFFGIDVYEVTNVELDSNMKIIVAVGHENKKSIIDNLKRNGHLNYSVISEMFEDYVNRYLYFYDRIQDYGCRKNN